MDGIPDGFHTLTTYLFVAEADAAIAFYRDAFGASELLRLHRPDGRVLHAEVQIGDAQLMLAERVVGDDAAGGVHVPRFGIHVYVTDLDAAIARAVAAGAVLLDAAADTPDGERRGAVVDPFGCTWWIATQRVRRTRPEIQRLFDRGPGQEAVS
jgi:PhnB protein